jgi:hypothetical protein
VIKPFKNGKVNQTINKNKIMKKKIVSLSLMSVALLLLMFTSCKKVTDDVDDSVSAEDNSSVSEGMNSATDDVANVVGGIPSLSGKTDGFGQLCGATIDSSQKTNGIIVITFNGNDCSGRISRTGSVTATIQNFVSGTRWRDAGAVLDLDFSNVVITRIATGGHFTLNGRHTLTNETGGLAWRILNGLDAGTVRHRHTASSFQLTFADGTQRTWNVNRLRTFTNIGGVRTVTLSSDHTENGVSNADAWGTNRRGDAFVSAIVTPISSNSICGWYKPTVGEATHTVANRSVDVLFGVDVTGNPISQGCAYGFKITYTKLNRTRTRVVSYWF